MVHTRLNERESNPNKHINFITPLHADDAARDLLRALAAQVRPIMKAHGFAVNSFEEYEYNQVFAGRNWNNGETVEIVLRGKSGHFQPMSWLMSTLCHELAHIKHMNHGREFQALWSQLRAEVRALQNKGYYGDGGYWSSGTRLADSERVGGMGLDAGEFPEYICGGAHTRARPTARRRRRTTNATAGPSNHTGRQTAKRRKAGTRVRGADAFVGEGTALNADVEDDKKKKGTGFRKVAGSKRAREERALAAERRMKALRAATRPQASTSSNLSGDGGDNTASADEEDANDDSEETVSENDQERRKNLFETMNASDLDAMKKTSAWTDFVDDFDFHVPVPDDIIELFSDDQETSDTKPNHCEGSSTIPATSKTIPSRSSAATEGKQPGIGKIVQSEIEFRKKENLGMTGNGRTIGTTTRTRLKMAPSPPVATTKPSTSVPAESWECLVCTLHNQPGHLACSACATPRGDGAWSHAP